MSSLHGRGANFSDRGLGRLASLWLCHHSRSLLGEFIHHLLDLSPGVLTLPVVIVECEFSVAIELAWPPHTAEKLLLISWGAIYRRIASEGEIVREVLHIVGGLLHCLRAARFGSNFGGHLHLWQALLERIAEINAAIEEARAALIDGHQWAVDTRSSWVVYWALRVICRRGSQICVIRPLTLHFGSHLMRHIIIPFGALVVKIAGVDCCVMVHSSFVQVLLLWDLEEASETFAAQITLFYLWEIGQQLALNLRTL